jgi:hypothetical protein
MASRKPWRLNCKIPGLTKTDPSTWAAQLERGSSASRAATTGAPEGYIEGFANIYREATRAIYAEVNGEGAPQELDFPTVEDGVEGMAFITGAVQSSRDGGIWTRLPVINSCSSL